MQFIKYWPLINEELGTLESGITESLESGIHGHGIRNPNVGIQTSESGIHGVESGIHDSLGFPYMGRFLVVFNTPVFE